LLVVTMHTFAFSAC